VLTAVIGVVGQSLLNRRTTARSWLLMASAGIVIAAFGVTFVEPSLVLAIGGREVTGVVTKVQGHHTGKGAYYQTYALRLVNGTPIPGQLFPPGSDIYRVGDRVTVLADPANMANPDLPGNLNILPWSIVTGVGLLTILVSLAMIGRAGQGPDEFWPMLLQLYGLGRDHESGDATGRTRQRSPGKPRSPGDKKSARQRKHR
jgi:hypothetical protein